MKKISLLLVFILIGSSSFSQVWTQVSTSYPGGGGRGSAAFSIGDKCYFVGGAPYTYQTWSYDTLTTSWTSLQPYPGTADGTYIGFAVNGMGYVGTGTGFGNQWDSTMWQYNPVTDAWKKVAHFPGQQRGYDVGFMIDGKCFIGCGIGNSKGSTGLPLNDFYEYDPVANSWTQIANYPGAGNLYLASFTIGDKAYVGCGITVNSGGAAVVSNDDFYEYDTTSKVWTPIANFGGGNRASATTFNTCDKGYVGLGYSDINQSVVNDDFWQYDPVKNQWKQIANFGGTARFTANGFVIGRSLFVGLGVSGPPNYTSQTDMWEFIPTVTPGFTAPTSVCTGQPVTFTDTSGYNPTNWQWNFPGGTPNSDTAQNPIVTYSSSGSYDVTLTAWNGCDSGSITLTKYITVSPYSGSVTITPDSPSVCHGQTITLIADGGAGATYQWVSANDTTDSIIIHPTQDTTYELIVGTGNCSKDTLISVTVNNAPPLVINPPSPAIECNGEGIILTVPASGSQYVWSPAIGLNATTGSTVTANPTADITYTVTGLDSLGCAVTDSEVINIQLGPSKPIITVSVTGDTLISSAINGNQWFVNGTAIHGATDSVFVIKGLPNNDTITVSVTNVANGCSTTSDLFITGINPLAINSRELSIYPNPTNGIINVNVSPSATGVKDWTLQFTDVLGRMIYSKSSLNYNNTIDLSGLPGGIYFITIINRTGKAVFPIVKQN